MFGDIFVNKWNLFMLACSEFDVQSFKLGLSTIFFLVIPSISFLSLTILFVHVLKGVKGRFTNLN